MNVAIIGSNCLADSLAQRFHKEENINMIYTYDLPDNSFKSHKITNSIISDSDQNFEITKKFWLHQLDLINKDRIDLIIATNLFPQLWKYFFNRLKETEIPMLIPNSDLSWIEWSKVRSKQLFRKLGIPSSNFIILSYQEVKENFKKFLRPYVLKYDQDYREGLQSIIINDENVDEEYENFLSNGHLKIKNELKNSNSNLFVKEEYIKGKEYSYHVLCNGRTCKFIGAARDYKKRFENDIGFNTGSMGSYSPVDYINHSVIEYAQKILDHFSNIGINYKGIMYLGIIIDENNNHNLLEVNTRFGDPEFISIIPTIENNISKLFLEASLGEDISEIQFNNKKSVSLRLVNKEYNLNKKTNYFVPKFSEHSSDITFSYGKGYINLGPVLTATSDQLSKSSLRIQRFLSNKNLGNYVYRKDIGLYL
jgi:phosphoribosylamine--glycine ligase